MTLSLSFLAFGIIFGALISEDAALLGALALYKQGSIPLPIACAAPTLGIILGDLGLFYFGSLLAKSETTERISLPGLSESRVGLVRKQMNSPIFKKWRNVSIFIARFIPGARLPAYLGAGLFKVSSATFLAITISSTLLWVSSATLFATHALKSISPQAIGLLAVGVFLISLLLRRAVLFAESRGLLRSLRVTLYQIQKLRFYEFWPAWLFYFPVGIYYFYLGIKQRSFSSPLYSNPGIPNSGTIGESKSLIFSLIPDYFSAKLRYLKLDPKACDHASLVALAELFIKEHSLVYPVILKPDVGQRGSGVVLVQNSMHLSEQLRSLGVETILQEYCSYPEEIGVNYVRYPLEGQGKITGITRKRFPSVTGDGIQTLAELILNDTRARYLARLYFNKHQDRLGDVIVKNESYILARIGNHCQGAIFENGENLINGALEKHIDQIAQSIPGFFVGRFDIRFEAESSLRQGGRFKIIEINGAAGEATHIYDRQMGVFRAYAVLFAQLRALFEIGRQNRDKNPAIKTRFWRDLLNYRKLQKSHPQTS